MILNKEHLAIRETVSAFIDKEINPHTDQWETEGIFPAHSLFKKMGDLGLLGISKPTEFGGMGLDYSYQVVFAEELGLISSGGVSMAIGVQTDMATPALAKYGNDQLRQDFLAPAISGDMVCSIAVSEPTAGSDVSAIKTSAVKDGDDYIINGTKMWITNSTQADYICLLANTSDDQKHVNKSLIIVPTDVPGFSTSSRLNKLGMRASETAELIFEDCKIPSENMLGKEGDGFIQAMKILDGGRISIAALSLGIAKGAYEAALKYSKEREQFGKPISEFQAIAFKLADMATQIEAAELLTLQAADLKNRGQKMTTESAMAKYYASEVSVKVATDAVQIFGGYGYTKDFPVEKFYRDCKLCTIGEGTSEIQKLVISRNILKD